MTIERIDRVHGVADPVGPFSHAVVSDGLVFTSGQLPAREDGTVPQDFEAQVEQTIANLAAVLEAAGSDLEHVLSMRGFLTDAAQLEPYNRVCERRLGAAFPARTTVGVSLWGVALEIDCIARVKDQA